MKLGIKILVITTVILAFLFGAVYLFLFLKGRTLITKQLEALTHKKVSMDYFGVGPLLNIEIKNLNIEGLGRADSISISPSIMGFLVGTIALNDISIVSPEVTYQRFSTEAATGAAEKNISASRMPGVKHKGALRLIFKNINIKDGKINFIDHTVGKEGIRITIKELNFNLTNLYVFPRSVITNFELKGNIPWQEDQAKGKIEAEGWLNLFKKNMQATLKIEDIDGIYLYPYYSQWVDLEKARIEKAKLNFTSNIHSLNNDVVAQCHLELTEIVRKPRPTEEPQEKAERIANAVLDIFRALNQGKIVLDFTIKTKMDKPEFGFGNVKRAFEDKFSEGKNNDAFNLQNILTLPTNILQRTVKSATDLSKAVIDGTFTVGNELKKAVENTFKKEKEE